jgi:hypothetical protein
VAPHAESDGSDLVFVVGSPRSGTTILAEAMGRHPELAFFYEPYFLWDFHCGNGVDDRRTGADATPAARAFLRREMALFRARSGRRFVVEKTPENSFKIDFIRAVFPRGRFVHIVRNGYDCVLSIRREWERRQRIVEQRDVGGLIGVARRMLERQPFWRNRAQALWFEAKNAAWREPRAALNKSKWKGQVGWGPRFPGWEGELAARPRLVFHALQWGRSVEAVLDDLARVPEEQQLTLRYERLCADPEAELGRVFAFVGVAAAPDLAAAVRTDDRRSGRAAFSPAELALIDPIIEPVLARLDSPRAAPAVASGGYATR